MLGTSQDTSHGLAQVILTDLIIIPTVQPRKLRLRGIKSFCSRSHINWEAEPGRKPVCAAPQDFGQIPRLTPHPPPIHSRKSKAPATGLQ